MKMSVTSVDYAPPEREGQTPFQLELLRKIPGIDGRGRNYWIAVAARWQGTQIGSGMRQIPVNIPFVTDISLLEDSVLDIKKCTFVAIGTADEL